MEDAWIRHVETLCEGAMDLPMWGHLPDFPLGEFGERLAVATSMEGVSVGFGESDWREDLLDGLGEEPVSIGVMLSPINQNCFWVMDSADVERLCSWSFHGEKVFTDPDLKKGYYQYVLLEALNVLTNEGIYSDFSPKMTTKSLSQGLSYCVDVSLSKGSETIWGRLILPKTFHFAMKSHYEDRKVPLREYAAKEKIVLDLPIACGKTKVKITEWNSAKVGDLLVLDQCSYSPDDEKGYFQIKLSGSPIFQVKLKQDHIKILDFAYHDEDQIMTDDPHFSDADAMNFQGDFPENAPADEIEPLPDEEPEEFISPEEEVEEEISSSTHEGELIEADKVNLSLVIEIAKLQMPLDQLLNLKPGSTLPLSVKPSQGVTITLNGRPVGRGQLLQMDELLGVKITEIAK